MAKASPTQAWLWHRRVFHLNFDYINLLSKKDIVISLPKLKYVKDQLCSSCELSKAKRSSFKSKAVPSLKGMLNLLYMDLCGPMWVASINGKKYILGTGQRETRPVWNNTGRINHQNKLTRPHPKRNFVPAAILTKSGQVPVNAAKQSSHKAAASVSVAKRVNTAAPRPNVNSTRPKTTQDLVIIKLIQRVKWVERELKARTPPIKVQKVVQRWQIKKS
nr:retrovirus-related Pol polyprotein from transposon TNT 1-94 [Tanacetum cinerariifolium]